MNCCHLCFAGFCAALVTTLVGGCAPEETKSSGGLMVVTTTDLQIPKDVSKVGIQVIDSNGVPQHGKWYTLGASPKTELPATLAIDPGRKDGPIQIRVFAQRGDGSFIALSEATTTVPRNRVALLRMPIEWLSVGMVKATNTTSTPAVNGSTDAGQSIDPLLVGEAGFGDTVTTCPQGMTPRAGTCETAQIDSSTLPTYTPGQVNGGGNGSGNGTCFDTVGCFANAVPIVITDRQNCVINSSTLAALATITSVNSIGQLSFGLVPADGSGICGAEGCIVTLDYLGTGAKGSGWTIQSGTEVKLPAAVCEKLNNGSLRAIVAAMGCNSKTPETPNCGPWSSVDSTRATSPIESDLLSICWDFAERACEGIERCRGGAGFVDGAVEDGGTCTERMRFLCDASLVRPEASPWRKYFTDCGAAFAEPSCTQMELKIRTACVEPSSATPRADGTVCSFGQCTAGSTCYGAVPYGTGQCRARGDVGAMLCATNSAVDATLPQGACKAGLICEHSSQTCRNPAALGAACADDSSCQSDLVCVKGNCAAPVAAEQTCGDDTECAPGLHCISANNKQLCRGPGQAGESCRVVATNQQAVLWQENICELSKGLRCDPETGTCGLSRLVTQGSACTTVNTCAGGYCSGKLSTAADSSGTCIAYHADGTTCSATAECGPPAECLEKVCRLHPVFGCVAATMQLVPGSSALCANGKPPCNTGCTDLNTDSNNCGQCNIKCPSDAQCVAGTCTCGSQQVLCNGVCTAINTDPNHCGTCDTKCTTGQTCSLGLCTGCSSGLTLCGTTCVNFLNDASHCGDCSTTCAQGDACVSGNCQVTSGGGGASAMGGTAAAGGTTGAGGAHTTGGTSITAGVGGSVPYEGSFGAGGSASVGGTTLTNITTSTGGISATKSTVAPTGGTTPVAATSGGTSNSTTTLDIGGTISSGGSNGSVTIATGGSSVVTSSTVAGTGGAAQDAGLVSCPAATQGTSSGPSSIPQLSVTGTSPNMYVTSGDGLWYGYVMMELDDGGSTISPLTATLTSDLVPGYCTTGQVINSFGSGSVIPGYAGFGFYLQQSSTSNEILTVSPSSAGVNVQVVNHADSPLYVQISGFSAAGIPAVWCAPVSGSGGYIPWSAFNTGCGFGSGTAYRYEPIQSIAVIATPAGTSDNATSFDYCLINIAESGFRTTELVNANGWVGGDANLTTDDPAGIQGSIWAGGDGVAFTPPSILPCNASGCCINGSTIIDGTGAAWGGNIGIDLGYFPNAQASNAWSACPYRGDADCFDVVLSGTTGGNAFKFETRSTPGEQATGSVFPMLELPSFSDGWSGRVCFSDLACPIWDAGCVNTGERYSFGAVVLGGNRNSMFDVCLTSLKAVTNN